MALTMLRLLAVVMMASCFTLGVPAAAKVEVSPAKITLSGARYRVVIDTDGKVAISSLVTDSVEWLGDGGSITSELKSAGVWESSAHLTAPPKVTASANGVDIAFSTPNTTQQWSITAEDDGILLRLQRRFLKPVTVEQQGFPYMRFGQDAAENIRWRRSGSNFWIGGKASGMKAFLAAGDGYTEGRGSAANIRRGMEDSSFTLLTGGKLAAALQITSSTNRSALKRATAIEVDRERNASGKRLLTMALVVSSADQGLKYATGSENGSPLGSVREGHVRFSGEPIYAPVEMKSGQTDEVTMRISCGDAKSYYDLGTLKGVDERLLSEALNNYGRMMVLDYEYGTTQENPNIFFEVPAFQQHWNTAMGSIMRDDGVIESLKNGLRNIKNGPQVADGHIISPYIWQTTGSSWYSDYGDMCLGYVLGVANIFNYTNDTAWAAEMRRSVRLALDYEHRVMFNEDAKLIKNMHPFNPHLRKSYNNYWEKSEGAYDGYNSVLFYEALTKWAAVERAAFHDGVADDYEQLASEIKAAVNRPIEQGGLWNDQLGALMYGSGNVPIAYLPPNAAALRARILSREHARRVVDRIESDTANLKLGFHVMNVRDLRDEALPAPQDDDPFSTMLGENGGWYGAPDGDFYAGYPAYGDRNKIPYYITHFGRYFEKTGFVGGTTWKRDGVTPQDYGWQQCMPHTVMPIWGLYTYAYGFQPEAGRLVIAPFISDQMVGSTVYYRWAKQDITVQYHGLYDYSVSKAESAPVVVRFINQTSGGRYRIQVDDKLLLVTADADGNVDYAAAGGNHRYKLSNPDAVRSRNDGNIALHKPVTASSTLAVETQTMHWPEQITDGNMESGAWFAADEKYPAWVMLDLGYSANPKTARLYFGRQDEYTLRIEAANQRDASKWVVLAKAVKLQAGPDAPLTLSLSKGCFQYWRIVFEHAGSGKKANLREWELGGVSTRLLRNCAEEPEYQHVAEVNYARGASVTVSSEVDSSPSASWNSNKINDGIRGAEGNSSGWSSAGGSQADRQEWVVLDLGKVESIARIRLYPRNDAYDGGNHFPIDYQLMVSADGSQWQQVADVHNQPMIVANPAVFEFAAVQARYVKMLATKLRDKASKDYYCQISEFEVLPPLSPAEIRNAALNGVVTASSGGAGAASAVDGNLASIAGSEGWVCRSEDASQQSWLQVDMKSVYQLREFRLYPYDNGDDNLYASGFPVDYSIQVSTDGVQWTSAVDVKNADRPSKAVIFRLKDAVSARYVRLMVTRFRADDTGYQLRIAEFEAYGRAPL